MNPSVAEGQGVEPTTLHSFLVEAEANNPGLLAAREAAAASAARVPQAGALPDPMFGIGIMNLPVADPSLSREMMTMLQVQVGEQFPFPGKIGLREEIARFEAAAADWEVERVRQEVRTDVKAIYYQIYFIDRALDVTGRNEALVGDFARLTSARYGVGGGAQPDVLKAQVERTRLENQLVALRRERSAAVAQLNALLARPTSAPVSIAGLPERVETAALATEPDGVAFVSASLSEAVPDTDAGPAPGVPALAELERLALEHNPMIQAHGQRVAARERAVTLAGKAALPDFNVSVGYSHRPDFADFATLMVSIPLPVFSERKQDQGVVESRAELARHQAMYRMKVNEVNARIASLVAELGRAREQLVLLNEGILLQARTSLSSATTAYQVGRVDFLTLLDAQVTLYRHELEYHRLLTDFARNLAALEGAVGMEILG